MKALGISAAKNLARIDILQAYYSIAGRDLEREMVPLLKDQGTGLLVWSPLAGGLLSGKFSRATRSLRTHAAPHLTSPSWTRSAPGAFWMFLVPSPKLTIRAWLRSPGLGVDETIRYVRHHRRQACRPAGAKLAAVDLQLTEEETKQLDEVSALPPEYPGWMVPFQNANRLADVPRF